MVSCRIEWVHCPIGRNKIREDTILKNDPLYCPKCKRETLIDTKNLTLAVHKDFSVE